MEHNVEATDVQRNAESEVFTKRKVLCVDDDEVILKLLWEALTEGGFCVVCESDAQRARQMAHSLDFDAVVLDYEMPGCDGLELASAIRANKPSLPIIMFSGILPFLDPLSTVTSFVAKNQGVFPLIDALRHELRQPDP